MTTKPACARLNLEFLRAVSAFAIEGPSSRYYLEGVRVEIDERSVTYVATDGHRLLAWRDAVGGKRKNTLVGRFTIPTRICRIREEGAGDGVLSGSAERLELQDDGVAFSFAPLRIEMTKAVDGWVDWRRVVPKAPLSGEPGHFNGEYLAAYQTFAHEMDDHAIVFHNGWEAPAVIRFQHHPDALGVLMPIKQKDFDAPIPAWAINSKNVAEKSNG